MDFKIVFEKPKVHIETNDCIDVVDNSIVFRSVEKLVKEVTEYSIVSESPHLTEFNSAHIVEVQPKDAEVIVVTEYVPAETETFEKIELENVEQVEPIVVEQVDIPVVDKVLTKKEVKPDEDKNDCKIEDVSNVEILEDLGESTEPIISLFRDEKIIKISVESDEIQITEFKSDSEEVFEEEKEMRMQVDTSEIEEGNVA